MVDRGGPGATLNWRRRETMSDGTAWKLANPIDRVANAIRDLAKGAHAIAKAIDHVAAASVPPRPLTPEKPLDPE